MTWFLSMPGRSHSGNLPPLTSEERDTRDNLRRHVETLAGDIGERNLQFQKSNLGEAARYLLETFDEYGYESTYENYHVRNETVRNVVAKLEGFETREEPVVVGAHYDTVPRSPGANDNGSGLAAMLEIGRLLRGEQLDRSVHFVAFVNEEPPFYMSEEMGSYEYARRLHETDQRVNVMISLETIGYYRDEPGSQQYPPIFNFFYPDRGNFLAFVGNLRYRNVVRSGIGTFRRTTDFPSEGVTVPSLVPGVSWSDHWSFWKFNFPAFMVTDTAPYRYPHYHRSTDTPDKIQYQALARVTHGMEQVVREFANQ